MVRVNLHVGLSSVEAAGMPGGSDLPEATIFRKISGAMGFIGSIFFASSAMGRNLSDQLQIPIRFISPRGSLDGLAAHSGKSV
jgi:hypothetical protein